MYSLKQIDEINEELIFIQSLALKLQEIICDLDRKLKVKKAKEYLQNGVIRRMYTLRRCIDDIFYIFPVCRSEILSLKELHDITVNIQAFFINITGISDNLAWVINYENCLGLNKSKICLFK